MNATERKILKKAIGNREKLNDQELDLVDFLAGVDPGYRLRSQYRNRLYAIGKKIGIDGEKDFAAKALEEHDRELAELAGDSQEPKICDLCNLEIDLQKCQVDGCPNFQDEE